MIWLDGTSGWRANGRTAWGILMLFVGVLVVLPMWRICQKAGYSGWLSLLTLVPIANLLLVCPAFRGVGLLDSAAVHDAL